MIVSPCGIGNGDEAMESRNFLMRESHFRIMKTTKRNPPEAGELDIRKTAERDVVIST
jgi:hypothetical protein